MPNLLTTLIILPCLLSWTISATYLNISASAAINGATVLQCWQLSRPLTSISMTGPAHLAISRLFLGDLANATYSVFPPKSDLGLHSAPRVQWVISLSGLAHVTLPNTTAGPETEAWLTGGRHGLFFAADTNDVSMYGHGTLFPGDGDTIFLQIPTQDGKIPEHTVLYNGPCRWTELVGAHGELAMDSKLHDEL